MGGKAVKIAYYKSSLDIEISDENLIGVLTPTDIYKADDLKQLVEANLDRPVGAPAFDLLCRNKKNICVIVCDLTRPMQTDKVLPIVLRRIEKNNPEAKINILIAVGTHRPLSDSEIDYLCGPGIRQSYAVYNHESSSPDKLVFIKDSTKDYPLSVNKILYESDFKIAIGAVKPHPIFGWSGGAKIIIPGVAGYETIGLSHWRSCPYRGVDIMGVVENPIRAEVESMVERENLLDFIINAVLTEDSEIADVRCGHFIKAHRACVDIAKQYYIRDVPEEADAVLVGVGKWGPDLWLSSMSIYQTEFYLKKGGTIVLFAACPEGVSPSHPEIQEYGYHPYGYVKKLVEDGTLSEDLTLAAHLVHVGRVLESRKSECFILSEGIGAEEAQKLGFKYMPSPEQVIGRLKKTHGERLRILAIPGFNSTQIISEHPAK